MKKTNIYKAVIPYKGRKFRYGPYEKLYGSLPKDHDLLANYKLCKNCPMSDQYGFCNSTRELRKFITDNFYNGDEFCAKTNVFIEIIDDTLIKF